MKWILLVIVIALAAYSFRQQGQITDLSTQLEEAKAEIAADQQAKARATPPRVDAFGDGRPQPQGYNLGKGTLLDAAPGQRAGRH